MSGMQRSRAATSVVLFSVLVMACSALGDEWPCYKKDGARSSVTGERLRFPLAPVWQYEPDQAPRPCWPQPGREMHRNDFDYAFQPVIARELVYFGSSADDTVRALDLKTGVPRWRFTTGGPVRFAPHVWRGRCYFGSDDGFAYCVTASEGALVWKVRLAPSDRQLLGNGRMISRWPCRTGVLVAGGVAFVTAGMWPSDGVYVYALNARTGEQIWCNDTSGSIFMPYPHAGSYAIGGVAPQGYLLVSKNVLLVPTGRSVPAAFDRRTGKLLYYHAAENKYNGGTWGTVNGAFFFNPAHTGAPDVIIELGESGPRPGDGMLKCDVATGKTVARIENRHRVVSHRGRLYAIGSGTVAALDGEDAVWSAEHPRVYSMALARRSLLVGGAGSITAFSKKDGKPVWRCELDGQARGLAIAKGRLVAATDKGTIICYARAGSEARELRARKRGPAAGAAPETAARVVNLVREANITKGWALVLGEPDARLAEAVADQTGLNVVAPLPDAEKVESERRRLIERGGVYGSRVAVQLLEDPSHLPYGQYFANIVVVSAGVSTPAAELWRVLRPCGGVMCFVGMTEAAARKLADMTPGEARIWADTVTVVRGKLPGAFDWDSKETADERVKWPLELLWFGGPGPARMISRHWRAPTPVPAEGRYFVKAERHLIGVDAYNGVELWSRHVANLFTGGVNVSADNKSVYLNFGDICVEVDAQTGVDKKVYGHRRQAKRLSLAQPQTLKLAVEEHSGAISVRKTEAGLELVLTTKTPDTALPDAWELSFDFRPGPQRLGLFRPGAFQLTVFAPTQDGAAARWRPLAGPVHPEPEISGRLLDDGAETVLRYGWDELRKLSGAMPTEFAFAATLIAAANTRQAKQAKIDEADSPCIDNGWTTFVIDAKKAAPVTPGLAVGKLSELPQYARAAARAPERDPDLPQRIHPLTRAKVERIYKRAYGCGGIISAAGMDFFRSGTFGFYDLEEDSGLRNFAAARPGCGLTMVPALGMLIANEGSSTCTCSYSFKPSLALAPAAVRGNEDWAVFYDTPPLGITRHAALNLAAPGDRRDDNRLLWLGIPRPQTGLQMECHLDFNEGFGPYRVNADRVEIAAQRPWVYASGMRGLRDMMLELECFEGAISLATDQVPEIDGRLDEACWDETCAVLLGEEKASAMLRHDADNLYIGYRRPAVLDRRGRPTPWKDATRGEDAPVWDDDAAEVFLSNKAADHCAHLGLSASGARYDASWRYEDPYPVFDIPRLDGITIDGKSDDWGEGGFHVRSLMSADGKMCLPEDFDPSLRLGWNDKGVLLLAQVRDQTIIEHPDPSQLWAKDSIEVLMGDRRGTKEIYQTAAGTGADPNYPKARKYFWDYRKTFKSKLTGEAAGSKMDGGYVVEMLMPWEHIRVKPVLGREVGLQVFINDADAPGPYPGDWFRASWHPGGHPAFADPRALHRLRLAAEPGPPIGFTRGDEPDDKGFFAAQQPYPYPLKERPIGKRDEDAAWTGAWSSAAVADDEAFIVEMAIPWETLAAAGLSRDDLTLNFATHGPLADRPKAGYLPMEMRLTPHSQPRPYTVRLHFAELDDVKPGRRVFDVKLQGKTVLEDFDVVKAAGGSRRPVVREFKDVVAASVMALQLVPKSRRLTDRTAPIISAIEVIGQ